MITVRKSAGIGAALALALTLTACSSSGTTAGETPTGAESALASASSSATSSVGAASEAFCTSSAALKAELGDLKTLVTGGSVTKEALQSEKASVSDAGEQAKTDAQSLDGAVKAEVTTALSTFQSAIDAIPDDQTGVMEVAAYVAATAAFAKVLEGIASEVGCS